MGYHWQFPETWLIEAKGSRRLGQTQLRKGASQLSATDLMQGPHMRVLCGTNIEHRLFMTIDIESVEVDVYGADEPGPSGRPSPDENDEELLVLASSRMLNYYALQGLPRAALTVRPVGSAVMDGRRRRDDGATDLVSPLEGDETTREERAIAQDPEAYARRPGVIAA